MPVLEVVSPPRVLLDIRDVFLVRVGADIHVVNCVEPVDSRYTVDKLVSQYYIVDR